MRDGAEARLRVVRALRDAGIGVQVHYIPVYRLPLLPRHARLPAGRVPAAEELYAGAISLPMFPGMADADVERVVDELGRALP